MIRFDQHYINANKVFDDLILKQKQCASTAIDKVDAYYKFMEVLQSDIRFRGSDFAEQILRAPSESFITSDDLLNKSNLFRKYETFVYFSGTGRNYHKVWVNFDLEETIQLQIIKFFYHEENGRDSFFFQIAEKRFSSDSGNGDTTERPIVSPVTAILA